MRDAAAHNNHNHLHALQHKRQMNGLIPKDEEDDTDDQQGGPGGRPGPGPGPGQGGPAGRSSSSIASSSAAPTSSVAPRPSSSSIPQTSSTPETSAQPSSTPQPSSAPPTSTAQLVPTTATGILQSNTFPSLASRTFNTANYASSSAASPSATAAPESSPKIGTLVGIIGGGLVGVVVLAAIAGWFFRRATRNKNSFDRDEFVRNSMAIPDQDYNDKSSGGYGDTLAAGRPAHARGPSATPRPPTMIERRAQAPSFQPGEVVGQPTGGGYYADPNGYYNYSYGDQYGYGYGQQQQYNQAVGYTPPSQYQQSELTRRPSAPLGSSRGPGGDYPADGNPEDYARSPDMGEGYFDPSRQSVTPFQQQQYNEINRQLNGPTAADGAAAATGAAAGATLGRSLSTAYSSLNQPSKTYSDHEQGNRSGTPTDHNPQQTYYQPSQGGLHPPAAGGHGQQQGGNRTSVYDDDDAYGGI